MLLFILGSLSYAATYYVATTGDDAADGTSEETAWRTLGYASARAIAGDTVYVRAGEYTQDPLVVKADGTPEAPLVFEGYRDTPGDAPDLGWSYPDKVGLNPSVMPLLEGGDRSSGIGVDLISRSYVTVRNLQITGYEVGVYGYGATGLLIENVVARDLGDVYASYSGKGLALGSYAYDNVVRGVVIYNAAAEGISVVGDRNTVEDCSIYCDDDSSGTDDGMDYYIVLQGDDNTVTGNHAERVGDLEHGGHGIGIKGLGEGNLISDNTAVNFSGSFYVRHRGVMHNRFTRNVVRDAEFGILIRDGASENTFERMRLEGCGGAIAFMDTSEDEGAQWAGSDNLVQNSVIEDSTCVISYHSYSEESPAYDNIFANLTIRDADTLACADRTNYDNVLFNSVITGVRRLDSGSYPVDLAVSWTAAYDNDFELPEGAGNLEADPRFVSDSDLHLRAGSPCIDAGTDEGAPADDMDGDARPVGEGVDMGAYEYEPGDDPGTDTGTDTGSGSDTGPDTGSGSDTGTDTGSPAASAPSSCGCSASYSRGLGALSLLALLALGRRRR